MPACALEDEYIIYPDSDGLFVLHLLDHSYSYHNLRSALTPRKSPLLTLIDAFTHFSGLHVTFRFILWIHPVNYLYQLMPSDDSANSDEILPHISLNLGLPSNPVRAIRAIIDDGASINRCPPTTRRTQTKSSLNVPQVPSEASLTTAPPSIKEVSASATSLLSASQESSSLPPLSGIRS